MTIPRTYLRLATGLGAAAAILGLSFVSPDDADAARRRRRGKALAVQRINVDGASGVPGNQVIEVYFTTALDPTSVGPATFLIREQNATQTGFTKQVFGDFQVAGRIVRFYPRLPGHLRDPADPEGGFYREGSARDDATTNAGLRPSKSYQISLLGRETFSPLRSRFGRPLRRTRRATFTTASATVLRDLYTTTTYVDAPPPQFFFSNPIDRVPTPLDQYAIRGGAKDVPNDLAVSLFCTRVPLSPGTARVVGNVILTILERKGNKDVRRPVSGSVFVEQNFGTTLLVYEPKFALADLGVYALRVTKNVKDLTEEYDFSPNRERERLRAIYDWLASERAAEVLAGNPNPDPGTLGDPPAQLVSDWPADAASRAVLKGNMLALGDNDPDEVDPRVMVLFSTRDEPVSEDQAIFDFDRADGLFDGALSTAQWDGEVPSAASAILTIAAGSGVDGDYSPVSNDTLRASDYLNHEINFRNLTIPPGVTVTVTGDRPVAINALTIKIEGTLSLDGSQGDPGATTASKRGSGGAAGPGGGDGGDPATSYQTTSTQNGTYGTGNTGDPGVDVTGAPLGPDDGGQPGTGGTVRYGTICVGGSGGGGGAQTAGANGSGPNWTSYGYGQGGVGGAGSANDDLVPLGGGAGGGAGGNYSYPTYPNSSSPTKGPAGAGGGGGGALRLSTATVLTVATDGVIRARGGRGGAQGTVGNSTGSSGGPGGGGGGGSLLLRSSQGFNLANEGNATDVSGGLGGKGQTGTGGVPSGGGAGGDGYVRLEDPNGGIALPGGGTAGTFDPVGGGVPSVVYSRFLDLGVEGGILEFDLDDVATVTNNDAIYVELQMTREDLNAFGEPDLTKIDTSVAPDIFSAQGTLDETTTSPWVPLKLHDNTGGRAFPSIAYDPSLPGNPDEVVFPVAEALNGKGYRFVRCRIFFQLDDNHESNHSVPYVGSIVIHFQFNF